MRLSVLICGTAMFSVVFSACANGPTGGDTSTTLSTLNPKPDEETIDHYNFMISCLEERGIAAEYNAATGGLDLQFGGIDQEALNEAIVDCRVEDSMPVGPPDEDYLRDYYTFLVQLHECLVTTGFPVPELITIDSYLESGGLWHPYDALWEASESGPNPVLQEAERACPNDQTSPVWEQD